MSLNEPYVDRGDVAGGPLEIGIEATKKYFQDENILVIFMIIYFGLLLASVCQFPRMFTRTYGRRHRLLGAVYLSWLLLGTADLLGHFFDRFLFDVVLGILGTMLTLAAAFDFKDHHRQDHVKNIASGALDEDATVTFEEMMEHSFYQGLNLLQIVCLHLMQPHLPLPQRFGLCAAVSALWNFRGLFPVNSFSANYIKKDPLMFTSILYRLKKYQYLLYKHFLFHALNILVLSRAETTLVVTQTDDFYVYWICLNTAYVMEFFMQTLVKRRYMSQKKMLALQILLMTVSTISVAVFLSNLDVQSLVLWSVVGFSSLVANLTKSGHDFRNALVLFLLVQLYFYLTTSSF